MTVSFIFGLGFLLLLVSLTGSLLLGENSDAKRLLLGIIAGFAVLVLVLLYIASPYELTKPRRLPLVNRSRDESIKKMPTEGNRLPEKRGCWKRSISALFSCPPVEPSENFRGNG